MAGKRKTANDSMNTMEALKDAGVAVGVSGNIRLCPDGKMRWIYEYSMLKNPVLFLTILKVFLLCALAPALLMLVLELGDEGLGAFLVGAKVYGIMLLIFIPLTILAYIILAAMYGWTYIVLFEMDENGVLHQQQTKQFKKAQGIAWMLALAGIMSKNPGRVGQGLLVATKNASSSEFRIVKKIKGIRRYNTIKISEMMERNQVYVHPADYDFVWQYITSRCPGAKISG
ncbi:MAG: hypothetical protein Q4B73_01360 [Lachnospiraceae bacterium]|nr:hypothetical protein [Lachnospiraceae bacterium]